MEDNMFFKGVLSDYQDSPMAEEERAAPSVAPSRFTTPPLPDTKGPMGKGSEIATLGSEEGATSYPYEGGGVIEEYETAIPSAYEESVVAKPTPLRPTPMQATSKAEFGYDNTERVNKEKSRMDEKRDAMITDEVDNLYKAVASVETGGERDPYIRTKYRDAKGGSSAFGPVQITMKLAKGYKSKHLDIFDKEEKKFLDDFIRQGNQFLKHGNMKGKMKGFDSRFDYGGKGDLIETEEDKQLYERVAKKMLAQHLEDAGGDVEEATRTWRYGPDHKGKEDPRYWKGVGKAMGVEFAGI